MKTLTALPLAALCLGQPAAPPPPQGPPATATVYIYRSSQAFSALANYHIYANGHPLCKLSNGRYIEYQAPAGALNLTARTSGMEVLRKEPAWS